MIVDLHCHSNVSDGALAPAAVVRRAAQKGVEMLALTDHDQLAGLAEAAAAAQEAGIAFVPGVEVSVTWRGGTVHVVGLQIDPRNRSLEAALAQVRSGRLRRADAMGQSLAQAGIAGCFEGALRLVANEEMIGRAHFARYLAEIGVVGSVREAFRKFLVPGRPGYVAHQWAELEAAVGWIRAAGGTAVLAHPGRYRYSAAARDELLREFRQAGGMGLEVVTSSHSTDQQQLFAALARSFGLQASRGSDFHAPEEGVEFGALPDDPESLPAVWKDWAG